MVIKETICTEVDEKGRITKRTHEVKYDHRDVNRGYDYGTRYGERDDVFVGSLKGIFEALDEYRESMKW